VNFKNRVQQQLQRKFPTVPVPKVANTGIIAFCKCKARGIRTKKAGQTMNFDDAKEAEPGATLVLFLLAQS
jgi:hypothetical protein